MQFVCMDCFFSSQQGIKVKQFALTGKFNLNNETFSSCTSFSSKYVLLSALFSNVLFCSHPEIQLTKQSTGKTMFTRSCSVTTDHLLYASNGQTATFVFWFQTLRPPSVCQVSKVLLWCTFISWCLSLFESTCPLSFVVVLSDVAYFLAIS